MDTLCKEKLSWSWDAQDTTRINRGMGRLGLTILLTCLVRLVHGAGCDGATGILVGVGCRFSSTAPQRPIVVRWNALVPCAVMLYWQREAFRGFMRHTAL